MSNSEKNPHLNIRIFRGRYTIEDTYMVYVRRLWQYAQLVFDRDAFLRAPDKINASLIQRIHNTGRKTDP